MNTESKNEQWYQDLDITSKGKPVGIERIDKMLSNGLCYCIISDGDVIERVDVYKDGLRVNYKKFNYDDLGRVVENMMYSPDGNGGWHNVDDIWYYAYNETSELRQKKTIKMPGATTAREILYDENGSRISEKTVDIQ
jgi:hypothetical protein